MALMKVRGSGRSLTCQIQREPPAKFEPEGTWRQPAPGDLGERYTEECPRGDLKKPLHWSSEWEKKPFNELNQRQDFTKAG